jgi:hypothetical protein
MKGQRKKRRMEREALENRRALCQVLLTALIASAIIWKLALMRPIASPTQMVAAQAVHGVKIPPSSKQPPEQPVTIAATNSPRYPGYLPVSFASLSSFPFVVSDEMVSSDAHAPVFESNTLQQIPERIQALSHQRVAVTGFMLPVQIKNGHATEFLLLKDRSACCYGLTPKLTEWIIAHDNGGKTKLVTDEPVTAEGTFHVGAQRENGELAGIYELDCDRVIDPGR